MKDKVPRDTFGISILALVLISIILYFVNQPNAILSLFSVVVLSVIYLGSMQKDHKRFMDHNRHNE